MKKIAILFLCIGMFVSSFAQQGDENFTASKILDEYVQYNRSKMFISYVYVSKAMMKVVNTKDLLSQINGINGSSLIDKLSSIQIVGVELSNKNSLQGTMMTLVQRSGFERLLRLQNNYSTTELFFHKKEVKRNNEAIPAELLLLYDDPKSCKVIVFSGNFTLDDVVKAMKKR